MNLGETIYRLRTEKNMSQGDLADKLEVSRQSISKWENNSAVPDLDKIVKLSELFQVSLDELVKGEKVSKGESIEKRETDNLGDDVAECAERKKPTDVNVPESSFPPRKIAGTILLCMAFIIFLLFFVMGAGFGGLILASPFLLCGIVCFAFRKNVGLWCAWAVYLCVDVYLRYATGITWSVVMLTHLWEPSMNYMRLGIGWGVFLTRLMLMIITVVKLRRNVISADRKTRNRVIVQWMVVVAITVFLSVLPRTGLYSYILANIVSLQTVYSLVSTLLDWCRLGFFVAALSNTFRFVRSRRKA